MQNYLIDFLKGFFLIHQGEENKNQHEEKHITL